MRRAALFGIVLCAVMFSGTCIGGVVAPSQSAALSRGTLQMAWTNDLAEAWRVSTNRLEEVFSEHDEQARVSLLDEYVQEVLSLGLNCHRSLGPA